MFIVITLYNDYLLPSLHYSMKSDFEKEISTNKLKI